MRCFLFDAALGRSIESSEPIEMDCSEALSEWDGLSNEPGSFFGIESAHHPAVQFMWEDADRVTIDVPVPDMGGSWTKQSDYDECCKVIKSIWDGESPMSTPELRFVSW
jgi:hypothetical protein